MGRVTFGRRRLGLGIARDRVSAVLLVGDAVRWADSRRRNPDAPLGDALAPLLAACPRRGVLPITVTAALGPSMSQVKCLTELPPIADTRALAAMVRENAGRFFLRNGVPLTVSGAHVEAADRVWIAAFDAPVVADVATVCRDAGLRLGAIVPSAMALRRAIGDTSISWADGDVQLEISYGPAVPVSVRRVPATGAVPALPSLTATLSALDGSAQHVLDAAGAALTQRGDALVSRAQPAAPRAGSSRRAIERAGAACIVALAVAAASPGIAASLAVRRDHAREAMIAARAGIAQRNAAELAATSTGLRALSDFAWSRQSMTLLLAQVTRGLPDSAVLVAFQVDSAGLG
ncbi:MAG: hypothetical protein ACREND_09235, partial [Gemmatimonadaceae bacterium]